MSTIKTGWLKDKNGDKFAPKTLSSQVIGSDGVNLEDKIQAQLDEFRNEMGEKDHNHDDIYEKKTDADAKLGEAKEYADNAAKAVKDDLLNGAGAAYDTLKELGDLIDVNQNAIEALETVATGKADKDHDHEGVYEEVGSIELAKAEIKAYVDEALASRIVVQMHTWEADD